MEKLTIKEKAEKILNLGYVCDHCLGRQFAQLLTGHSNEERGRIIRFFMALCLDSGEEFEVKAVNFKDFSFRKYETEKKEDDTCVVCNNFFKGQVEYFFKEAKKKLKNWEFENFLVGTKLTSGLVRNEEKLWEKVGIEYCEPIKSEINREVGRRLEREINKEVEFEKPEIVVLLNLESQEVELEVNSIYFYGEYNKLVRGIPQTVWPSGKYETSVQQIIDKPFLKKTKGSDSKLHASGREDIDARCLGRRPFILEILEPKKRSIYLEKIKKKINRTEKVEVYNLKEVSGSWVERLKRWRPDKTYKVIVRTEEKVNDGDLKRLKNLIGEINQETPNRVLHRRGDRLRKREIKAINWKKLEDKKLEITMKTEAGTYVKELITGDEGRTYPSVKEMLRTGCEPGNLDVLEIHIPEEKKP